MKAIWITAWMGASLSCATTYAQVRAIETITIHSSWNGLAQPARSDLVIRHEGDHYVAVGRTIPGEQVRAFLTAIEEPRIETPNGANLGITAEWLQEHAEEAGRHTNLHYQDGLVNQKNLFRSAFTREQTLSHRLASIYSGFHTDDYPHMSMELKFSNGTNLSIASDSQHPFMIPWQIGQGATATKTYNANISRALLPLLPPKFANREALTDENQYATGLLDELAMYTGYSVEAQWKALGAQHKAGDALTSLRTVYQVRHAEVNSYHNLDYGKEWNDGDPHEENLHVDLWRPGFPKNFAVAAVLLRQNGRVEGVDALPSRVAAYEQLVLSIGWLKKYWDIHSDESAWLFYVHGRSFTEKAMRIFAADMKEADREELIPKVVGVQTKAALLLTGAGDVWIILPDKSAILWRRASVPNVLLWNSQDFATKECTDYGVVNGGCVGAVISPEGKIVP